MKKVRNVVLLSSFLATIISLSSCDFTIFDEEKHFEDEKIEEAISLKEEDKEMKHASIDNIYSRVHMALSSNGNDAFPSYTGDYYEFIRSEANSLHDYETGMYFEPSNDYIEIRYSADSNYLTGKKDIHGNVTIGGDFLKNSATGENKEVIEKYLKEFVTSSFDTYTTLPYAWMMKEGMLHLLTQQSPMGETGALNVEKSESNQDGLLENLALLYDNGAGNFTVKLANSISLMPEIDENLVGEMTSEMQEMMNMIKIECSYIELVYQDYLLDHYLYKLDYSVEGLNEDISIMMAESFKYNVDESVYVPYKNKKEETPAN